MDCAAWLKENEEVITKWWIARRYELREYREGYRWPRNLSTEESLRRRADIAQAVRTEVEGRGTITRRAAERVLEWGGVRLPPNTDDLELENALDRGFVALKADDTEGAAHAISNLPGFGISRASKLLALSDED